MTRLADIYAKDVAPKLQEQFQYKNKHQLPAVKKIVVSMGVEGAVESRTKVDSAARDLTMITGQKAVRLSPSLRRFDLGVKGGPSMTRLTFVRSSMVALRN